MENIADSKNFYYICVTMKNLKNIPILLFVTAILFSYSTAVADDNSAIFEELDKTIQESEHYVNIKIAHICSIEQQLENDNLTTLQRYNLYKRLFNEYRAFQCDRAMDMLNKRYELSSKMGNRSLMVDDQIDRARLYATSGMYFEAGDMLDHGIDTLSLTKAQKIAYYEAQQRFHSDFWHYTSDIDKRNLSGVKKEYYRRRILELTTPDDPMHQYITVRNLTESGQWSEAEVINMMLLSNYQPNQHEYAMYAYDRARILEALERRDQMREWFARSAMADIRTATKDNASLCSLAQTLLEIDDIDHAFHYIFFSLNDAVFYNAKLRPWQISSIVPSIEQAYQAKQRANREELLLEQRYSRRLLIIISILAIALLGICIYLVMLLDRYRRNTRKIGEMNDRITTTNATLQSLNAQLESVNNQLSEANAVKEEYIALFLSMCSDYIEKMKAMQRNVRRKLSQGKGAELEKELSQSSLVDDELNNFYEMFDNAFLSLYPNFVEEFNALLRPDSQIKPKGGGKLSTELRIFALIRLGITDSSRIASLLRYSVNTIYNYRARIKNNALCDRDTFEQRIMTIGK